MKTITASFLLIMFNFSVIAQKSNKTIDWNADLEYLRAQIYSIFPNAKDRINENDFKTTLARLKSEASSLSIYEMAVEIMSLLSLTNDNDCFIYPFQESLSSPILPLKTYFFSDGLYICDASQPYKDLIGEKIEKIGHYKVDELFQKLQTVIPADNIHYQRYQFSLYSQLPSFLSWAEAIENKNKVHILTSSGISKIVAFESLSSYLQLDRTLASQTRLESSNAFHQNENYWMEFLNDHKSLFIQLKAIVNNEEGPSFSDFVKSIEVLIKGEKVEKIIIDNRYGGGGNGFMLNDLTALLRESKTINQKGKLFVLTSRSTKGVLLEFTSVLQLNTKATLIGEPTGEGPNTVGDRVTITLPSSKLEVQLTKLFWPTSFIFDNRKTIQPQISINYTFDNYLAKHDPWLKAIKEYNLISYEKQKPDLSTQNKLVGKYKVEGYKLKIYQEDGKLYAEVKKKLRSFFELHTELYHSKTGVLSSDIPQLIFIYEKQDGKSRLTKLEWFGNTYELQ